ncbi:hypothetical protein P1X14_14660 [Sphingomonas sp. AOB5]|uniref:hypothetical protein n=1 Tax=Sphingomonas sp. AOB5 TaxID=3034017 RepID=UPI0023F66869|nr:hypothetical protein [Sphingomonas sp. AOB5]MDF7776494.1 hypothetical protein [Sphingomonas sp. AOB5]
MPARNKARRRRIAPALLVLSLVAVPVAHAQEKCDDLRALTNADGRNFAGVSFGIARKPYRLTIRAGKDSSLPTPENCDFSADGDRVDLSCHWQGGDPSAMAAMYDAMFSRFSACLTGIQPYSGPSNYGGATAKRRSTSTIKVPGGETEVDLVLIEAAGTDSYASYQYITLSITHEVMEKD